MPYRPNIEDSLCFVLMPFGPPFDAYYENVIKPAVETSGLAAQRADEIYGASIIRDIWDAIWHARLIIADLTDRNANVAYELGLCHALGVSTILITQRRDDVPFDYQHLRYYQYNIDEADWGRFRNVLSRTIAALLRSKDVPPVLSWPYTALGIEAGINIRETRYRYADVIDENCEYLLLTGHNLCGQLGARTDAQKPPLYDEIIRLLTSTDRATVQLAFAPPHVLETVHPPGYKDLVEKSLPRMWDLANDPRLSNRRNRLKIGAHAGAMFMSTFVRDPVNQDRALIITTPRWVSDVEARTRMFVAIWRKERPELFDTLWAVIEPSLRTYEGPSLFQVVNQLGAEDKLGRDYVDFVEHRLADWRIPDNIWQQILARYGSQS